MKRLRFSLAAAAMLSTTFAAAAVCAPVESSAWLELAAAHSALPQAPVSKDGPDQGRFREAYADWKRRCFDLTERFVAENPTDPRRWEAVADAAISGPLIRRENTSAVALDIPETEALTVRLRRLTAAALADPALPTELRRKIELGRLEESLQRMAAESRVSESDREDFRNRLNAFETQFPQDDYAAYAERCYAERFVEPMGRAVLQTHWKSVQENSPSETARTAARNWLRVDSLRQSPIELKFTAVDGRVVDLAALRGRVVLIDFWGMDCHPCLAELPKIRELYERFHARGFEVIGIDVEPSNRRERLLRFVEENRLPWPQHHDGRSTKSEACVTFNVTQLPAVFLLDKSGRLHAQGLKGDQLETAVIALLGR